MAEVMSLDTGLLDLIKRRRTVRKFTDQDVTDEQVRAVLEAAVSAPTRFDVQPWHFVVSRDKALQKQLTDTLRLGTYLETAPVLISVWGEPDRSATWLMDCSAAIENLLLAATALGLGGTWAGGPEANYWGPAEDLLRRALGVPKEVRLASLVALGVPAQVPPPHGAERWNRLRIHRGQWTGWWD